MNQITLFNFNSHDIREITDKDGNPWFVAKDVCEILDLSKQRDAIARLDDDEKSTCTVRLDGWSQARKIAIVNEPGLYRLIMESVKPEAKEFKRWLTRDVLPSIRKTGEYQTDAKKIRDKSKKVRVGFTDVLKNHGYSKPHEYIQTTKQMKAALGITAKKDDMDMIELSKTIAAEAISLVNIAQTGAIGYKEVNPVCVESSQMIEAATRKQLPA